MLVNYIEKCFFFKGRFGGYCYVFCWQRMGWYSDCKRISKQTVELPKHQSGLAKYRHTGTTHRKKGSGRPVTIMTDENLAAEVEQLCQSQDDKPGTHKSQRRQSARIIGVSQRSVQRVLKRHSLHPFKRMRTSMIRQWEKLFCCASALVNGHRWTLTKYNRHSSPYHYHCYS